jgi:voltage-gated potassium channel
LSGGAANWPGMDEGGRFLRFALRKRLTPRRAGAVIALATLLITLAGGIAIRLLDSREFDNVALGLWWSVQTVTTVGYGDVVPHNVAGRIVGALLMLSGIGFLTVVTATITAALIESLRRRYEDTEGGVDSKLGEMSERLERLEALLRERT